MKQTITTLLSHLATSLGTTAKYLWAVEVKQGYIVAIQDFLVAIVMLILMAIALVAMRRLFRRANAINAKEYGASFNAWTDDGTNETQWMYGAAAFSLAAAVLFSIIAILSILHGISHALNPANYAFQQVMNYISNA